MSSPVWMGIIDSIELAENKSRGREDVTLPASLFELLLPLDWDLHHWLSWVSSSQIAVMGFLSLYNHVSQFLIINLFLYIAPFFCFSGEP